MLASIGHIVTVCPHAAVLLHGVNVESTTERGQIPSHRVFFKGKMRLS
jgi:hypothetical protein